MNLFEIPVGLTTLEKVSSGTPNLTFPGSPGCPSSRLIFVPSDKVDLTREIIFRTSKLTFSGVPIIASNMDTVGTFQMAKALAKVPVYCKILVPNFFLPHADTRGGGFPVAFCNKENLPSPSLVQLKSPLNIRYCYVSACEIRRY